MTREQAAGTDVPGEEEVPEAAEAAWAGRRRRGELLATVTGRAAMAESMVVGRWSGQATANERQRYTGWNA